MGALSRFFSQSVRRVEATREYLRALRLMSMTLRSLLIPAASALALRTLAWFSAAVLRAFATVSFLSVGFVELTKNARRRLIAESSALASALFGSLKRTSSANFCAMSAIPAA